MHQRKGKKVLIYFFLLIVVGSINNIDLNNFKFSQIKTIKISGLDDTNNLFILKRIKNLNLDNIFFANINEIKNVFEENTIVENYKIFKIYPSTLNIKIKKTNFLAQISNKGKVYFIGSNGKLSENKFSNEKLPFIFGNPDIDRLLNLKKIIDQSKISYSEIKNLFFFPSKRWDLELKNNIIIKLSNNNIEESLKLALEFLHSNEFKDIKIIDARIKNQIILNG
jgi:cell division protein FtsQ